MEQIIKDDILNVINKAIIALETGKHEELGELSNHVIHDASIYQDNDSLSIAILIYSTSKVVQRCCEQNIDYSKLIPLMKNAINALKQDNFGAYNSSIHDIFGFIKTVDAKMKLYIQEVIDKAKIKKGSKIHEHGLSIGRTAEIMGITKWELMNYVGKTQIPDIKDAVSVKKRLEFARKIFSWKSYNFIAKSSEFSRKFYGNF